MGTPTDLSPALAPILAAELARGNRVVRVDVPAGTRCPMAVVLALPLDRRAIESGAGLPSTVRFWESRDLHYPVEAGYVCESTRHTLAGPIGTTS